VFSLTALTVTFFGFFQHFLQSRKLAALGTFFLLFCNIALSLTHVMVFDNGSPFIVLGYTDTVASIATFLGFVVWLFHKQRKDYLLDYTAVLLPFLLSFVWCISAPQNIIAGSLLIGVLVLRSVCGVLKLWRRSIECGVAFALGIAIGVCQGGILTPSSCCDKLAIPGALSPPLERRLVIEPYLMFIYSHFGEMSFSIDMYKEDTETILAKRHAIGGKQAFRSIAFRIEVNLWESIRILFFPIAGIVLLWLAITFWKRKDIYRDDEIFFLKELVFSAFLTFILGYMIAFLVRYSHLKWELTRFLIPGVLLGVICMVLFLGFWVKSSTKRSLIVAICLGITFAATIGPIVEFCFVFHDRYFLQTKNSPLLQRIDVLVNTTGMHD